MVEINYQDMTFAEFMENPTGKGSTFINKNLIEQDLNARLVQMLNKHKSISRTVWKSDKSYLVMFKIPSEQVDDVFYDVLILFRPTAESINDLTISNYNFSVFSNNPAFVYTYAFAFDYHEKLIEFLRPKYSKEVFKTEPEIRNPVMLIGWEKSIFFAAKLIKMYRLNYKSELEKASIPFDKKKVFNLVTNAKSKEKERKDKEQIQKAKLKKIEENKKKAIKDDKKEIIKRKEKLTSINTPNRKNHKIISRAKIKGKTKK